MNMKYTDLISATKLMCQGMGAIFVMMTILAFLVYLVIKSNKH